MLILDVLYTITLNFKFRNLFLKTKKNLWFQTNTKGISNSVSLYCQFRQQSCFEKKNKKKNIPQFLLDTGYFFLFQNQKWRLFLGVSFSFPIAPKFILPTTNNVFKKFVGKEKKKRPPGLWQIAQMGKPEGVRDNVGGLIKRFICLTGEPFSSKASAIFCFKLFVFNVSQSAASNSARSSSSESHIKKKKRLVSNNKN